MERPASDLAWRRPPLTAKAARRNRHGVQTSPRSPWAALERLSANERVAVVLVHSYGYSYAETAKVLGARTTAVTNYVHRGLEKLRLDLDHEEDVSS